MDAQTWHRRVLDAAAGSVWVLDLDGRTLDANPAAAALFGIDRDQLLDLDVNDLLDDVGREQYAGHLADLRAGRVNPAEVECLFHRPDGGPVWTLVNEAFVRDDDGVPTAVVLNLIDISARKRLLDELRESEVRRSEVERIARLGSWRWDAASRSFQVSHGLRMLYGDAVDSVFASFESFLTAVHPDDHDRVKETVQGASESGAPFEYEARVRVETGYIWVRGRGVTLRDADGAVVSSTGTQQDITRARDTDDTLRDLITQDSFMKAVASAANAASTLDDVLKHARDMVLLHDDWDRARAFLPSAEGADAVPYLIEGDPEGEFDGEFDGEATAAVAARELATARRSLRERRALWDDEVRLTIAFPVLLEEEVVAIITITSLPPLYRHDMITTMCESVAEQLGQVALRERTARVLAEARDRAMEASQHKSDFLATMSHEIRTPLNGIIGLTELLARTRLDDHQQHLVSGVDLSSRALLAIINDILDFSKIEAGHLELEEVDYDIRTMLDAVGGVLADGARSRGLELTVSCSPDVPELVSGDPTRLAQVITNLGSNAVKFTAEGGVGIRATVTSSGGESRLRIEVRDTGVGVPSDRVAAIFQPFAQADASTTRRFGGTGLGLAISQEIVAAHGGRLGVESAEGVGSTFWVELPLLPPRGVSAGESIARSREELHGLRVLVVDDVATNREILVEQLAWWEVQAVAVADAEAAQRVLSEESFDVVVLDMAMPDVDGLMLARLVRADPRCDDTALVMLTSSLPLDDDTVAASGLDEVLTKPVSSTRLHDVLRQLRGHRRAPAAASGSAEHRPQRILVVEDNPVNQMVATGFLESFGYSPDTADDGQAALDLIERGAGYDLILMDVQMPRLDGYACTRELRLREARDGTARVPVVAMTATAVSGERERALDAGMDDFLTKPISGARLAEAVERWLGNDADTGPTARQEPSRNEAVATGVLDTARLAELGELSPDQSYLRRAVASLHTRVPGMLEAVRGAPDGPTRAQAAHALRGATSNLGLLVAADLAARIEMAPDDAAAALGELDGALQTGMRALEEYLATD